MEAFESSSVPDTSIHEQCTMNDALLDWNSQRGCYLCFRLYQHYRLRDKRIYRSHFERPMKQELHDIKSAKIQAGRLPSDHQLNPEVKPAKLFSTPEGKKLSRKLAKKEMARKVVARKIGEHALHLLCAIPEEVADEPSVPLHCFENPHVCAHNFQFAAGKHEGYRELASRSLDIMRSFRLEGFQPPNYD
ncbi:hypothetical protein PWT90_04656 [Aphanocladium album]|nr:hypothetical protein PWT90_04656 [Aphanocladium album]